MKRILVLDIGGSSVKVSASGRKKGVSIPSGPDLTPQALVKAVRHATAGWKYDVVSIGFPGMVGRAGPAEDAPNLGNGWVGFDFEVAFGRPVKVVNDDAMQALGSYQGGRMLFLGLGTGLGSALILEGVLHPMELGDLPFRNGRAYADCLGKAVLRKVGVAKWSEQVRTAVGQLKGAMLADYVVLGGGEAQYVGKLAEGVLLGDNSKAILGGFRLWQKSAH